MIAVCNRLPVHPDWHEEFEARFKEREALVDQMEGFISFQILKPTQEGDPYVVMTIWEDMKAFEGWKESQAFKKQHDGQRRLPPEALIGRPKIEIQEIIQQRIKQDA